MADYHFDKNTKLVLKAFTGPRNFLRTVDSIVEDTRLPESSVLQVITQNQEIFMRYPFAPGGDTIYTIKPEVVPEIKAVTGFKIVPSGAPSLLKSL